MLIRLGEARRGNGTGEVAPKSLLTSVVRCGKCGQTLAFHAGSYHCSAGRSNTRACGRLSAKAHQVDRIAIELLLDWLAAVDSKPLPEVDPIVIAAELELIKASVTKVNQACFVERTISDEEHSVLRADLLARLESAQAALVAAHGAQVLPHGDRDQLSAWWATATLQERRAAMQDTFAAITIAPARKGGRNFETDRVSAEFRAFAGQPFVDVADIPVEEGVVGIIRRTGDVQLADLHTLNR